jgi:hypothetical protein
VPAAVARRAERVQPGLRALGVPQVDAAAVAVARRAERVQPGLRALGVPQAGAAAVAVRLAEAPAPVAAVAATVAAVQGEVPEAAAPRFQAKVVA